ncbi:MAG: FmdB family zinc ribbon protein [Bacillota bacterium]
MPTYDFKCKECAKSFTVQTSIKDKGKVSCPACGTKEIQQKFNRVNLGGVSGGNAGSACTSGSCGSCSGC